MIKVTMENELNSIVYQQVVRGEYPEPVAYVSDEEQRLELASLRAGTIDRPSTKMEYVNRLAQLEAQIKDIASQNEQINVDNTAARKAVDDGYTSDIAAAKLDEVNIWKAIRSYRNYLLSQCDWTDTVSAQTRLSDTEKEMWNKYRQELRDITKTFSSSKDVIFPTINIGV